MSSVSPFAGRQVLILSSVDWNATWQRHHSLAESCASAGAEVFFVENTGFRGPQLQWGDARRILGILARRLSVNRRRRDRRIVAPMTLPPTQPLFKTLNAVYFVPLLIRRLKRMGLKPDPIVLAYLPTATTLEILSSLAPAAVIYDCVDNFAGHPTPPPGLARTEGELIRRSDLVLTTSQYLYEEKKDKHPHVILLHHGVSRGFFLEHRAPKAYRRLCYFGTVWSAVDFAALRALGEAGFEVDLIGPVKGAPPPLPPSVRLLPQVDHDRLPQVLAPYDALLLPYADIPYNLGVAPAKLYECLATGKPVLASRLRSLEPLRGLLYLADKPSDFPRLAAALPQTETDERSRARIEAAREHSAPRQFARLGEAVSAALARRHAEASERPTWHTPAWAESLLRGFSWIALFFAGARGLTLLTQYLAAHLLGPDQYGRAHLMLASGAVLQTLPMLGFPFALSRQGAAQESDAERRNVVSTALTAFACWAGACALGVWAWAEPLARLTAMDSGDFALTALIAFAMGVYLVCASCLQGLERFKSRGVLEAVYGTVSIGSLAALWVSGVRDYRALVLCFCAGLAAATIHGLWLLRGHLRPRLDPATLRELLPFACVGALNVVASASIQAPGRILLYHSVSSKAAGIFSVYFTATVQVSLALVQMFQVVLIPMTSRPGGQREAWTLLRSMGGRLVLMLWPAFAAGCLAALALLEGRYPLKLSWLATFSLAAALIVAHGLASAVFSARDLRGLAVSVGGALAAGLGNLALTLFLVPRYGVSGAALSLALGYLAGLGWYALHRPPP